MRNGIARSALLGVAFIILAACTGGTQSVRSAKQGEVSTFNAELNSRWQRVAMGGFTQVNLYVPASTSPVGEGRSLLIILHGCMQAAHNFQRANLEKAAEEFGMIMAVPDARYKNEFDCWTFWRDIARDGTNDYSNLLSLVAELKQQTGLKIDANQVYISGISSGGVFAMQTACLAPEVFAGMGIYAAPSAGTGETEALQSNKAGTAERAAAKCLELAGSNRSAFATQIMNAATGENDNVANPEYAPQNAQAMALVYNVPPVSGTTHIPGGTGAIESLWQDNRVSLVVLRGIGHDWSGGGGAAGAYITGSSINYGHYLARFLTQNNKRVKR